MFNRTNSNFVGVIEALKVDLVFDILWSKWSLTLTNTKVNNY